MRFMSIGILLCIISIVFCKTSVKTLTEAMGQEIIEIEGPKELPPGLEEEPGADSDDDDDILSSTLSATKNHTKKTTSVATGRRNLKDVEKIDGTAPEDEEARLEKELAEIYKDSDYKDITEETIEKKETTLVPVNTEETEKPIARSKNGFKFAPDSTSKVDVEKFRTSIDDISCKNRQRLSVTSSLKIPSNESKKPNSADKFNPTMIITHIGLVLFTAACI